MSSKPRPKPKIKSLKRPTAETRFYIDYGWWEKERRDLKTYLFSRLPVDDATTLETETGEEDLVDLVDPETGEVRRVDGFQYRLKAYFNQLPEDFLVRAPLADAVFYVLLANANQPLSARELARRVHRDVETVLRTISGPRVYLGIRPLLDE